MTKAAGEPARSATSPLRLAGVILYPMLDPTHQPAGRKPRVALFVTCIVDVVYPDVGMAAVSLLGEHGADVVFPEGQTCCGQPAFNSGRRPDARKIAVGFLDVFGPLVESGEVDAIVAPSGSCVAMVRHSYEILLAEARPKVRERAHRLAECTYELTEYLVDVLGVDSTDGRSDQRITYHACCHLLRDLGVDRQPRLLLEGLRDEEVIDLEGADECCGFGGMFALWNADISTEMGRRKARHLEASGADVVAVADVGCMTHMNGILTRDGHRCRAVHVAELLAKSDDSPS